MELHSLGTGRRPRAALAVGTASTLGTAERYAVHSAIALLTLTTERSRSLQAAEQRIGAAVLRMLLAGEPDHARAVAGDLYGGLLDAPFRLAAWSRRCPALRPAEAAADPLPPRLRRGRRVGRRRPRAGRGRRSVVAPYGERLVCRARARGRRRGRRACAEYAATLEAGGRPEAPAGASGDEAELVLGLSAPAGPIAAATAYKQAEQALSVARRRGRALVEHEELAAGSVLPLLADDAVRAFADGLLRALYEHDATGRGDLVASLRAWLSRHGQWDAAAADLGVHRHTLRYRMRRVEEILGRSLDDPDVRMELWLVPEGDLDGRRTDGPGCGAPTRGAGNSAQPQRLAAEDVEATSAPARPAPHRGRARKQGRHVQTGARPPASTPRRTNATDSPSPYGEGRTPQTPPRKGREST